MSDTVLKTLKDAPAAFRALVREDVRHGDKRESTRFIKKGHKFNFKEHERKYVVERDMLIEVEETYTADAYAGSSWEVSTWHWETARPAPTRRERLKAWLMHPVKPSALPEAKVVKDGP